MEKEKHRKGTIGLRSKALLHGVKKRPCKLGEVTPRVVRELHAESYGPESDTIANGVKAILKGKSFNRFTMTGDIRLVPQYIWNQRETDKIGRSKDTL